MQVSDCLSGSGFINSAWGPDSDNESIVSIRRDTSNDDLDSKRATADRSARRSVPPHCHPQIPLCFGDYRLVLRPSISTSSPPRPHHAKSQALSQYVPILLEFLWDRPVECVPRRCTIYPFLEQKLNAGPSLSPPGTVP